MLRTVACGVIATELSSVLAGAPLAPLPFFLFLQVYWCIAEIFLLKMANEYFGFLVLYLAYIYDT